MRFMPPTHISCVNASHATDASDACSVSHASDASHASDVTDASETSHACIYLLC